jgi:hypothetical protein
MTAAAEIADALAVDEADIRHLVTEHLAVDLHGRVPAELIAEVHDVLDPYGARTVPEFHRLKPIDWRDQDGPL